MVYLQMEDDRIPIGNFSFVYDHTKNEELFNKFYEACLLYTSPSPRDS